jgi:CRISPR-associated endoribonuclease Cas6
LIFELLRVRLHFRAMQPVIFPAGKSGNVLRGAFGVMLQQTADRAEYARIFAPKAAGAGPSGLADPPRPFVFRAAHLDGARLAPGAAFHFDVHLFDVRESAAALFVSTFSRLGEEGLGPGRGRAALLSAAQTKVAVELNGPLQPAGRVRVRFVTPTELKAGPALITRPEFAVLFARLRDRISTLRALYGAGPLAIDFRALGERAGRVRLARCELTWTEAERRSSRTGQTHPLGGFRGEVEYEGELGEFLPYLRAGQWTGVGRQTVWGKGELCCDVCS